MWDSMYDTFQTLGHHELSDQSFQFETIDVEPIEKDALRVSEHISDSVKSEFNLANEFFLLPSYLLWKFSFS